MTPTHSTNSTDASIAERERSEATEGISSAASARQLHGLLLSDKIDKIFPSFVKAWSEMDSAIKTSKNDHFSSKYANFSEIVDAIRPSLSKHGLAPLQGGWVDQYGVNVTQTMLIHSSGQWISDGGLRIPVAKDSAHAHGSGLSYEARYGLKRLSGVPTDDDDGNLAEGVGGSQAVIQGCSRASQPPIDEPVWPFGKNKGTLLSQMDDSDLSWFLTNRQPEEGSKFFETNMAFYQAVSKELLRRAQAESGDMPL